MLTTNRVSHLSDARQIAHSINVARQKTDPLGLSSDQLTMTVDRNGDVTGNWNVSGSFKVAGTQVIGPRQTGWVADTGTGSTGTHATYTAGTTLTYSASYTQSELTATGTRIAAIEAALQAVTQEVKSLKDALFTHGLIGT